MFDIGFAELLTIGIVALLVLGPDRLPGAVRSTALVLGKLKRQAGEIKREIEREIDVDGIRRDIQNDNILADLERNRQDLAQGFADTQRELENIADDDSSTSTASASAANGAAPEGSADSKTGAPDNTALDNENRSSSNTSDTQNKPTS